MRVHHLDDTECMVLGCNSYSYSFQTRFHITINDRLTSVIRRDSCNAVWRWPLLLFSIKLGIKGSKNVKRDNKT